MERHLLSVARFVRTARADIVERGVAPDRVVEAVDIAGNGLRGLVTGIEDGAPDHLGFDRLEERLDHSVVVAISLFRHGDATSRTASSSNSFVNRRCFVIEFAFHLKGTLHFSGASPDCRCFISVEKFKKYIRREVMGAGGSLVSCSEQLEDAK